MQEGVAAGGIVAVLAEACHVVDGDRSRVFDFGCHSGDVCLNGFGQGLGLSVGVEQPADFFHVLVGSVNGVAGEDLYDFGAAFLDLVDHFLFHEGHQDQVGIQLNDLFHGGLGHGTDGYNILGFSRVVAVIGASDQLSAFAQCVDDFGIGG
ncbi:hypothetical protein SDC9_170173 [bioreactor metagenome]|uniref:NAD-specific glutamate dehydrogenase n=1 Tax=bioreactor metagenome TaxID=1076179 RepID=A0A645GAH3_9ZZZZ